jgi:parallel beta-helix repeat protein
MNKKILPIGLTLLLVLSLIVYTEQTTGVTAETVYVDDNFDESTPGYGDYRFSRITDGIAAVDPDGTVEVADGTYYEHFTIDKQLNLIGENRDLVIVEGNTSGTPIISVTADSVSIEGLTIQHVAQQGIRITGATATITNCAFHDLYRGLILWQSNGHTITSCDISTCEDGLYLQSSHDNTITSCTFYNNTINGVYGKISEENTFDDCTFYGNGARGLDFISGNTNTIINCEAYDNGVGFRIAGFNHVIEACTAYDNSVDGISLSNAYQGNVTGCQISNNDVSGIYIAGDGNTITDCMILSNGDCGINATWGTDNKIFHNNLINNAKNAYDVSTNSWDHEGLNEGNYWSDFDEPSEGAWDNDSDGIVDTAYNITGGTNQDEYPLMTPYNLILPLALSFSSEVDENASFIVSVTTEYDDTVENATVQFNGVDYFTDATGTVTLIAPAVGETKNLPIIASKNGYYSHTLWIIIKDTPPSQASLVIDAPTQVTEGETFQITITADGSPVADVTITFADATASTNTNGVVTLTAPAVEQDVSYPITAEKTGYQTATDSITVLNQISPMIQVIAPNGGETWQNTQQIQWTITPTTALTNHAVTIQYQQGDQAWITIVEHLTELGTPYSWDTTMVPDGYPYVIQVILESDENLDGTYETIVSQDTSDNPFAIDNTVTHTGTVAGYVQEQTGNDTIPVIDAVVCLILSEANNEITSRCTFTDENGTYTFTAPAGTYTLKAGKDGYITSITETVTIWANETTLMNFTLETGTDTEPGVIPVIVEENREEINYAIAAGNVGAELIIQQEEDTGEYESIIVSYDMVQINLTNVTSDQIALIVDGDENTLGKTIILSVTGFDFEQGITVEYDGVPINMADDLLDVLNPRDDGSLPEILLTQGADGWQLAISIPHFSEHEIMIYSLGEVVETLVSITSILLYIVALVALAIITGIPIIRLWRKVE